MKFELGKYLLDLSKIIFATAFLGTVLSEDVNKFLIVGASLIFVVSLAIIGLILIKKK
jgi:hypothetical protein